MPTAASITHQGTGWLPAKWTRGVQRSDGGRRACRTLIERFHIRTVSWRSVARTLTTMPGSPLSLQTYDRSPGMASQGPRVMGASSFRPASLAAARAAASTRSGAYSR